MNTQTKEEEDHWSGKLIGKKKGSNREAPSSGVVGHPRRRGNPGMEDPSGRGYWNHTNRIRECGRGSTMKKRGGIAATPHPR